MHRLGRDWVLRVALGIVWLFPPILPGTASKESREGSFLGETGAVGPASGHGWEGEVA